jgi:hypothetical protein
VFAACGLRSRRRGEIVVPRFARTRPSRGNVQLHGLASVPLRTFPLRTPATPSSRCCVCCGLRPSLTERGEIPATPSSHRPYASPSASLRTALGRSAGQGAPPLGTLWFARACVRFAPFASRPSLCDETRSTRAQTSGAGPLRPGGVTVCEPCGLVSSRTSLRCAPLGSLRPKSSAQGRPERSAGRHAPEGCGEASPPRERSAKRVANKNVRGWPPAARGRSPRRAARREAQSEASGLTCERGFGGPVPRRERSAERVANTKRKTKRADALQRPLLEVRVRFREFSPQPRRPTPWPASSPSRPDA